MPINLAAGQFNQFTTVLKTDEYKTFWCYASGSNIIVTAGAINGIFVPEATIPTEKIPIGNVYLEATTDSVGRIVAVRLVGAITASALNHIILCRYSNGSVTPLAWNLTQAKTCNERILWR